MMIEPITNVFGRSAWFSDDDIQSVYNWGALDERERIIAILDTVHAGDMLAAHIIDSNPQCLLCQAIDIMNEGISNE
jgi:hypothetical protein